MGMNAPVTPKLLLIGPVYTLVQNQHYAMPARACKGYISTTTGLEGNTIDSTTGMSAITITAHEFTSSAPFIRSTATATIRLQAL
jgi:hypothetical protein